jgi:hypothetical protein
MARPLPEDITITHGPITLLSRFVLRAHETARRMGFHLSWHSDMEELMQLNRANLNVGGWYALPTLFNPAFSDVDDSNAAWIRADDDHGRLAAVVGLRMFDFSGTNFGDELLAGRVFVAREGDGEEWEVTAPSATKLSGDVFYPGALWVRPDLRKQGIGYLLCHLAIALAWGKWNPDHAASVIGYKAVEHRVADQYGLRHIEWSVFVRNSPRYGTRDLVLAWTPRAELRLAIEDYASQALPTLWTTEQRVATRSPDLRRHGSTSLS